MTYNQSLVFDYVANGNAYFTDSMGDKFSVASMYLSTVTC